MMLFGSLYNRQGDYDKYAKEYSWENFGGLRAYYEFAEDCLSLERMEITCENAAMEEYMELGVGATMEAFEPRLEILRENFLKNWYEKAKKFVVKMYNKIKGWFKSIFGSVFSSTNSDHKWYLDNKSKLASMSVEGKAEGYTYEVGKFSTMVDKIKKAIGTVGGKGDYESYDENIKAETKGEKYTKKLLGFGEDAEKSLTDLIKEEIRGTKKKEQTVSGSDAAKSYESLVAIHKQILVVEKTFDSAYKLTLERIKINDTGEFKKEAEKQDNSEGAGKEKEDAQKALNNFKTICGLITSGIHAVISCVVEARSFYISIMRKASKEANKPKEDED